MKRSRDTRHSRRDRQVVDWFWRWGVNILGRIVVVVLLNSSMKFVVVVVHAQQQNPLTMNGGSVLAMAGKNCVVLAVDKRFGSGWSLINVRHRPIIQMPPTTLVAFTGMEGDVQSLYIELYAQIIDKYNRGLGFGERNQHRTGTARTTSSSFASLSDVKAVAMLTSHILYRRKRAPYYVEPVVVGLRPDGYDDDYVNNSDKFDDTTNLMTTTTAKQHLMNEDSTKSYVKSNDRTAIIDSLVPQTNRGPGRRLRYRPYLCCMDMIGAKSESDAFACAGTASKSLYGTAEALWEPDLPPDQLVSICTNAFLSALERDCLSGYGATVYLLTADGITEYDISGRSD